MLLNLVAICPSSISPSSKGIMISEVILARVAVSVPGRESIRVCLIEKPASRARTLSARLASTWRSSRSCFLFASSAAFRSRAALPSGVISIFRFSGLTRTFSSFRISAI